MGKLEGTLVCFVSIVGLTFLLGWIPVIGFVAALFLGGLIGGLIARSVEDGIIAGFVGGLLGSIIASILIVVFLSAIFPRHFLGGLIGGAIGIMLILISIPFALISCIGGAVGGAINKEPPSKRYVSPLCIINSTSNPKLLPRVRCQSPARSHIPRQLWEEASIKWRV